MKRGKWDKHIWEDQDIKFLQDNYKTMTNQQLADGLGIRLTTCRNKLYELGLQRFKMEYWTEEQVQFLRDNYKIIGDTEMAEIFNDVCPKEKLWTKNHIVKKMKYLNLNRSAVDRKNVIARNFEQGRFDEAFSKLWKSNTVTDVGEIRFWKYSDGRKFAVIKTENGFEHYNRWLFQETFHNLNSKQVVLTKSGEAMAQCPSDLLVIDRTELARRNSLKRYPEELRETVQLLRSINSNINQ